MSYELVIERTKEIESILKNEGAVGRGLHSQLSSMEHRLDKKLIKQIRFIATVRNKLLHEHNYTMSQKDYKIFDNVSIEVIGKLKVSFKKETLPWWKKLFRFLS